AACLFAACQAHADMQVFGYALRPFVGFGLTSGGDRLLSATDANGNTQAVHAGGLFDVKAGVDVRFTPTYSSLLTLGYHFDTVGNPQAMRFSRKPIELLGYYNASPVVRLGIGARFVSGAKLTGAGAVGGGTTYGRARGSIVEAEYAATEHIALKVRYVAEHYQPEDGSAEIDGHHYGLYVGYYF
ncbi:MAG TPA: hypothetical protein VE029_07435, partial [Rhizobacter sp.]|nr:hypothetical protein [Rhizobacter sp.]